MTDDRCPACGHDHGIRSQEPDELTPFRPGHSDYCDCDCLVEMLRQVGAEIQSVSGLSHYLNPRLDKDGIPIPDGIQSGYAMNILFQTARVRQAAYDLRHGNGPDGDGSQEMWDER